MYRFAYALAFLTGWVGLIAQIVWARQLVALLGVISQAAGVTLALFLGSLAIGALLFGKRADQVQNPFHLVAILLGASGILLAASTLALPALVEIDSTLLRIVLAGCMMVPPTTLWGGILPILIKLTSFADQSTARNVSLLYGLETFGAATGALAAGFCLIPALGLQATAMTTSVLCFLVSIPCWMGQTSKTAPSEAATFEPPNPQNFYVLLLAAWIGMGAMGAEVLWTRLLLLVLGSDTYSYTTVVVSFLVGLSIGALSARRLSQRAGTSLRTIAWLQLGLAFVSLLLIQAFPWLTTYEGQSWLASYSTNWNTFLLIRFAVGIGLLIGPAILYGIGFPLMAAIVVDDRNHVGRQVGRIYAAVCIGNVVGAVLFGFWVIHLIGLQYGMVVVAAIHGVALLICIAYDFSRITLGATLVASLLILGTMTTQRQFLTIQQKPDMPQPIYYREGPVGTVAVIQDDQDPERRQMTIDGIIIGESKGGVDQKQRVLGSLPALIETNSSIQNVLTIGLGTGIVLEELGKRSQAVTCIELSPAVIEGAQHFSDLSNNDRRVVRGDGIFYLRHSSQLYDAIVSDAKSKPGSASNAAFYSLDYYQLCRKRLSEQGTFVQWVSLETPTAELKIILRTFAEGFPIGLVAIDSPDSIYLIGRISPIQLQLDAINQSLEVETSSGLAKYGWSDGCDVAALMLIDTLQIQQHIETPVNTMDHPIVEFTADQTFGQSPLQIKMDNIQLLLPIADQPPAGLDTFQQQGETKANRTTDCWNSGKAMLEATLIWMRGDADWLVRFDTVVEQALRQAPNHQRLRRMAADVHWNQSQLAMEAGDANSYMGHVQRTLDFYESDPRATLALARLLKHSGNYYAAAPLFYRAAQLHPGSARVLAEFAELLESMQKTKQAIRYYGEALEIDPDLAFAHLGLGRALAVTGPSKLANDHLNEAARLDPSLLQAAQSIQESLQSILDK